MSGWLRAPAALPPQNNPGNHCIKSSVGPRTAETFCRTNKKVSCPYRDSNHGPSSPWPSHYSDYDIPAPHLDIRAGGGGDTPIRTLTWLAGNPCWGFTGFSAIIVIAHSEDHNSNHGLKQASATYGQYCSFIRPTRSIFKNEICQLESIESTHKNARWQPTSPFTHICRQLPNRYQLPVVLPKFSRHLLINVTAESHDFLIRMRGLYEFLNV